MNSPYIERMAAAVSALGEVQSTSIRIDDRGPTVEIVPTGLKSAIEYRHRLFDILGEPTPLTVVTIADARSPHDADRGSAVRSVSTYVPPATDNEKFICAAVAASVDARHVGMDDDLFDLDADSLTLIELSTVLSDRAGAAIDVQDIFEAGTVGRISALLPTSTPS